MILVVRFMKDDFMVKKKKTVEEISFSSFFAHIHRCSECSKMINTVINDMYHIATPYYLYRSSGFPRRSSYVGGIVLNL